MRKGETEDPRHRAFGVWETWDDEEIEHEMSAWKILVGPPAGDAGSGQVLVSGRRADQERPRR